MRGNEGTYDEALLFIMERNGYPEETYYTFSYSPVPNDEGGTGGIICANTEDTRRIVNERQLALLREQAARTQDARTIHDASARSMAALAADDRDVVFALLYFADPGAETFSLACAHGIAAEEHRSSGLLSSGTWALREVLDSKQARIVRLDRSLCGIPTGPWPRPPSNAAVLPLSVRADTGRCRRPRHRLEPVPPDRRGLP
ncbi:MAG: hypothetical protein ACRENE_25930 [Polyangiaceae bacterium]